MTEQVQPVPPDSLLSQRDRRNIGELTHGLGGIIVLVIGSEDFMSGIQDEIAQMYKIGAENQEIVFGSDYSHTQELDSFLNALGDSPGIFVWKRGIPRIDDYYDEDLIGPYTYHGETQNYCDLLRSRRGIRSEPVIILLHHSTDIDYARSKYLYPPSNDFITMEFQE